MQDVQAVGVHRGLGGLPIELAGIELGDVSEDRRDGAGFLAETGLERTREGAIAQTRNM